MTLNLYKDHQGFWRWRLIAANGKIIADSGQAYRRKIDARRPIEALLTGRPQYDVIEGEE